MTHARTGLAWAALAFAGWTGTLSAGEALPPALDALPSGPMELLLASGWVGVFLAGLSVAMVALAFELHAALRRDRLMPPELIQKVDEALDNGEYEQAAELCEENPCLFSDVVAAGLEKIPNGPARMADAMAGETDAQASALSQRIGWLSTIAVLAPMFGLLGTVAGMISSFGVLARTPGATADQMAAGIYVALMTTLEGLAVCIPATAAAMWFRGRATRILSDLSLATSDVLDRFRPLAEDPL